MYQNLIIKAIKNTSIPERAGCKDIFCNPQTFYMSTIIDVDYIPPTLLGRRIICHLNISMLMAMMKLQMARKLIAPDMMYNNLFTPTIKLLNNLFYQCT